MASNAQQTIQASRDAFITFQHRHNLTVSHHSDWRCCEPVIGQVNGLHNLRGKLVATNGILAYLEQPTGLSLIHVHSFVRDRAEKAARAERTTKAQTKAQDVLALLLA